MSKKGSKKNNSNRRRSKSISKSLLKTLLGGDDGDNVNVNVSNMGESEKPAEKKSAFDFFDKFSPPKDYDSKNGADEVKPISSGLFSSSVAATAATAASGVTDTEAPTSTWWFVFRVVLVLIIALIFILNMTGYLDDLTAWFTNTLGPYINPILVKVGLMESTPKTTEDGSATGTGTGTGTDTGSSNDNVQQLEQNIGAPPLQNEYREHGGNNKRHEEREPREEVNNIKPIPIQPDERQTPLINKRESARPPATQPAPYQEQKSREEEKQESIQKALEYAEKHPQYPAPDASSSRTQLPRSSKSYCYTGTDSGHRSCAEVSLNQECMSGDIFPSMDVCVNPKLRV
jgi:hypothetical protein